MGSYPYEGLHAEAVGIDADRVQLIGPEPDISIRRIVVFRAKEHTDQPTDPSVSHTSESGDVTGPTAWTEPTTLHVVCAIHERVSKRTYRATVHRTVGVKRNEHLAGRGTETGLQGRAFSGAPLLNDSNITA
jgi:hypothetical protein